jgi:hypothetical protein
LITKACRRLRGSGLPLAAQANAANGAASVTRLDLHKLFGAIKFVVISLSLLRELGTRGDIVFVCDYGCGGEEACQGSSL